MYSFSILVVLCYSIILTFPYLFIIIALGAKICHELSPFAQTAIPINIHCNELFSHPGSLTSATPSILDPHLDLDEDIIRYHGYSIIAQTHDDPVAMVPQGLSFPPSPEAY